MQHQILETNVIAEEFILRLQPLLAMQSAVVAEENELNDATSLKLNH
jgi:hypothetical protein